MKKYIFTSHAVKQLFSRSISRNEVVNVVESGEIIKDYPDDKPYASKIILGFVGLRPLHVVVAESDLEIIIITAYEPDSTVWSEDFKRRNI